MKWRRLHEKNKMAFFPVLKSGTYFQVLAGTDVIYCKINDGENDGVETAIDEMGCLCSIPSSAPLLIVVPATYKKGVLYFKEEV